MLLVRVLIFIEIVVLFLLFVVISVYLDLELVRNVFFCLFKFKCKFKVWVLFVE